MDLVEYARERLELINRFYSVYSDLVLISRDGKAIASSNTKEFPGVQGTDYSRQDWFKNGYRIPSGDMYVAEKIFIDPDHKDRLVSVFTTAVRQGGQVNGKPLGVLSVVFDWEAQAQTVVENESGLSREE